MKSSNETRFLAKIAAIPLKAAGAVAFWWRHGPISREQAERIDRIRFPHKYRDEVNEVEKP